MCVLAMIEGSEMTHRRVTLYATLALAISVAAVQKLRDPFGVQTGKRLVIRVCKRDWM